MSEETKQVEQMPAEQASAVVPAPADSPATQVAQAAVSAEQGGAVAPSVDAQARAGQAPNTATSQKPDGSTAGGYQAQPHHDKKSRFRTTRGWVALACMVFVLVGMALHVGIGTPSAFGIQQISDICPLGALETMAGAKGVMLHPLLLFVLVVVLITLVGKAFCAWMCPVPWLQKFFRPKARKENAKPAATNAARKDNACAPSACAACSGAVACGKALAPVGGQRDGVQLDSRHAVLVGTIASAAVFGFPVFCLICPVGLTFATIIGLWNLVQFDEPTWALIIFPIILVLEVTVLRKWCSKICPISALVGLLSNLNVTLRPRVKTDACLRTRGIDCHACVDACPEQLDPHSKRIPECSKCGKCVEACPAKAISIKLLK